jgi:hypothetical protein
MQTLPFYIIQFAFTNVHEEKFKVLLLLLRSFLCYSAHDLPEMFRRRCHSLLSH